MLPGLYYHLLCNLFQPRLTSFCPTHLRRAYVVDLLLYALPLWKRPPSTRILFISHVFACFSLHLRPHACRVIDYREVLLLNDVAAHLSTPRSDTAVVRPVPQLPTPGRELPGPRDYSRYVNIFFRPDAAHLSLVILGLMPMRRSRLCCPYIRYKVELGTAAGALVSRQTRPAKSRARHALVLWSCESSLADQNMFSNAQARSLVIPSEEPGSLRASTRYGASSHYGPSMGCQCYSFDGCGLATAMMAKFRPSLYFGLCEFSCS